MILFIEANLDLKKESRKKEKREEKFPTKLIKIYQVV